MSTPVGTKRTVSKTDIEAKLRELQGDVNQQAESARTTVATIGAGVAVVLVLAVFLFGKRRGRRNTTVVEVRRL